MGNSKSKKKEKKSQSTPNGLISTTTTTPTSTPEKKPTKKRSHLETTKSQPLNVSPQSNRSSNHSNGTPRRSNSNLSVNVPPNSLEGYSHKLALGSAPSAHTFKKRWDEDEKYTIPTLDKKILLGAFDDHWEVQGEVGQGATSRVYRCCLKSDPKIEAACKVVNKNRLGFGRRKKKILEHIKGEIKVLKSLKHPCIIRMLASYESDDYIHIVTELMEGGELFEYIVDDAKELNEETASKIVCRVARALRYMHEKGVLHRDLKPENLLLRTKGDTSQIKIIDFGFSKNCERTQSFLGTHGYLAPEMMNREEYTTAVDMWALGVCAYALMSGYLPFDEMEPPEPGCEIEWIVQFPEEQWGEISEESKDLIRRLLEPDPQRRYTAEQVLKHPWIPGFGTPQRIGRDRRGTQLLSPANLRMLSPAKSNRRTGGWKFWDDSGSRTSGRSQSIGSARSRTGTSPEMWAVTPSPGLEPSPLRTATTPSDMCLGSSGFGGAGLSITTESGLSPTLTYARSVSRESPLSSLNIDPNNLNPGTLGTKVEAIEETKEFSLNVDTTKKEELEEKEKNTTTPKKKRNSPLSATIDPNQTTNQTTDATTNSTESTTATTTTPTTTPGTTPAKIMISPSTSNNQGT